MPLFEYACQQCGHQFEAFVTADRVPSCPSCEGRHLAKQLSSPGMVGVGERRSASPAPSQGGGCGGACACRPGLN